MPVACSSSALTGQEGAIYFSPAGTKWCLKDFTDFPSGTDVKVPTNADYRVNDPIKFAVNGVATLDSALTAGTTYYVTTIGSGTIKVSASLGGTAITLNGNGGTGSADKLGHIDVQYSAAEAVAQVREFSIDIERELLDVTTLPGGVSGVTKYAPFRNQQGGFATASGSMTVYFTDSQTSLANRLLGNVLLKSQEGAAVKLYVDCVDNGSGVPDDSSSILVDSDVSITGMNLSVNPDDATTAELSFNLTNPRHMFSTSLT